VKILLQQALDSAEAAESLPVLAAKQAVVCNNRVHQIACCRYQ